MSQARLLDAMNWGQVSSIWAGPFTRQLIEQDVSTRLTNESNGSKDNFYFLVTPYFKKREPTIGNR